MPVTREQRNINRSRARDNAVQRSRVGNIVCAGWDFALSTFESWTMQRAKVVATLLCCAFCATIAFGGQFGSFRKFTPTDDTPPPASCFNHHMRDFMMDGDDWNICKKCQDDPEEQLRKTHMCPTLPAQYVEQLLETHPAGTQVLSLVDLNVSLRKKYHGFSDGRLEKKSLLLGPLVDFRGAPTPNISIDLQNQSSLWWFNACNNPLVQKYKCVLEQPHPNTSFPIIGFGAIENIVSAAQRRGPLFSEAQGVDVLAQILGVAAEAEPCFPNSRHDLYHTGNLTNRETDEVTPMIVDSEGEGVSHSISAESAIFPYLFPHGRGSRAIDSLMTLVKYLKWRANCMFSVFSLYKIYPLIMYQIRQASMIAGLVGEVALEKEIYQQKQTNPNVSDQEIFSKVLKYTVPSALPGSASWFRSHLQDLMHMVREWGMPSFFLTLTSDEVSDTKWQEITDIEDLLHRFNSSFTFQDAPIECSAVFHDRLQSFMKQHVTQSTRNQTQGMFGRVLHHVTRYEVQGRHSFHAHIILWTHDDDVDEVASEIIAYIPAASNDLAQQLLRAQVLRKQMHTCTDIGELGCRLKGPCQHGFPYAQQLDRLPKYNEVTMKHEYMRLGYEDRNVVPYHPLCLLLWGAHMNVQRITHAAFSRYLLKYALKCEPNGTLNMDTCRCAW